ncbi:MAG: hypothetical protein AB7O88_18885 [Reyranellaceae bacterium]
MRVLAAVCALLIGIGAALRLGIDLIGVVQRYAGLPFSPEPEALPQAVSLLLAAGAVLSLPLHIRMATARSDAGRPWLFAGSGALIATLMILVSGAVAAVHGGENMVRMLGIRLSTSLGGQVESLPVALLLLGLLAMAGRAGPAAGALLAAPLVMICVLSLTLEVSIAGSTLMASVPMALCAGALLPAVIAGRRPELAAWPTAAAAIPAFAAVLMTGAMTPGELAAVLLVPAIVAGIVGYLGAPAAVRGAWLERAAADLGGLILALISLHLVSVLLAVVPAIIDAKRALAEMVPSAMLALTFIAYIVVASFATPLVSVAIVMIMISAAYGGGVPADILVVGLGVAALQTTVTRGVSREAAPSAGSVALPPRQAAWAQTLIMIIITALAIASVLGWV